MGYNEIRGTAIVTGDSYRPDGDTCHVLGPVLYAHGRPDPDGFNNWSYKTSAKKNGKYVPVTKDVVRKNKDGVLEFTLRLEGIDAPELHYRADPRKKANPGVSYKLFPQQPLPSEYSDLIETGEFYQPYAIQGMEYLRKRVHKKQIIIDVDHEQYDSHGRVLGYVYLDKNGKRGRCITEELLRKGLAVMFLFESGVDTYFKRFRKASRDARKKKRGLWQTFQSEPLTLDKITGDHVTISNGPVNEPYVFRRMVDLAFLQGKTLQNVFSYRVRNGMKKNSPILKAKDYQQIDVCDRLFLK